MSQKLATHISEAIAELRLRLTWTKEGARKLRGAWKATPPLRSQENRGKLLRSSM